MKKYTLHSQPIRQLQSLLHILAEQHPQLPPPGEPGVFDEQTLEAVMTFQRDFHLPVTGIVDKGTWNAIQREALAPPHREIADDLFSPISSRTFSKEAGVSGGTVRLIQSMLSTLSEVLSGLERPEQDGILHGATLRDVHALLSACGCPTDGPLNPAACSKLVRIYRIFADAKPAAE